LKTQDGRHFEKCEMRYLCKRLTNSDQIWYCIMMHISPPKLIDDQKFENPKWQTITILKIKKSIYPKPFSQFRQNFAL